MVAGTVIDAVSNGRAQIILGRGSFTESYPLFGFDLRDYEALDRKAIAIAGGEAFGANLTHDELSRLVEKSRLLNLLCYN